MDRRTCPTCTHNLTDHAGLAGCLMVTDDAYCPCTMTAAALMAEVPRNPDVPERPAVAIRRDLPEGRRLRDEGAGLAGIASPTAETWRSAAQDALEVLASSGDEFSADDLVERVGMPPVPNMLGGAFLGARRRDVIRAVGFRQSERPAAHARVQRTWVGA